MMPAILLSTTATVLASIIKEYTWGAYLLAGLNGVIAFLLAVANYLKLDATSYWYKIKSNTAFACPKIFQTDIEKTKQALKKQLRRIANDKRNN